MHKPATTIAAACLTVSLVGLFSAACSPGPESTGAPGELEETIVYSTIRPANWDLYLFDETGAAPQPLTTSPSPDYNPVFSPDGRWVVFTSDRHGTAALFALALSSPGEPLRLTSSDAMEDAAAFSPDGRQLAFVSTATGDPDIFVMPFQPEGPGTAAGAVNLTQNEGGDFNPAFSPDGEWIAFSSNRATPDDLFWSAGAPDDYRAGDVFVMRPDGTDVKRLTEDPGWEGSPAWGPDGTLYFYSQREGDAADRDAISESVGSGGLITRIYRMNADGSGLEAVSASGESALSPAVVTDGRVALLGTGVRSEFRPHRRIRTGRGRAGDPLRDRRAGTVSREPAAQRGAARSQAEAPRGPRLSPDTRPGGRRGSHERRLQSSRGQPAGWNEQANRLRQRRRGSLSGRPRGVRPHLVG
jgi:Tol biopolymer transport system component